MESEKLKKKKSVKTSSCLGFQQMIGFLDEVFQINVSKKGE